MRESPRPLTLHRRAFDHAPRRVAVATRLLQPQANTQENHDARALLYAPASAVRSSALALAELWGAPRADPSSTPLPALYFFAAPSRRQHPSTSCAHSTPLLHRARSYALAPTERPLGFSLLPCCIASSPPPISRASWMQPNLPSCPRSSPLLHRSPRRRHRSTPLGSLYFLAASRRHHHKSRRCSSTYRLALALLPCCTEPPPARSSALAPTAPRTAIALHPWVLSTSLLHRIATTTNLADAAQPTVLRSPFSLAAPSHHPLAPLPLRPLPRAPPSLYALGFSLLPCCIASPPPQASQRQPHLPPCAHSYPFMHRAR
ncbi:hypothetical protein NAEX_07367 [Nannocystis exedens]|nr:hypothetical protein NAEX_07367 [Nannocystis exedens]